VTAVLARLIVPEDVIGPPLRPVPVATLVTVPFPDPGVNPRAVVTSELVRETFPVRVLNVRTPALFNVTLAVRFQPPDSPVPAKI